MFTKKKQVCDNLDPIVMLYSLSAERNNAEANSYLYLIDNMFKEFHYFLSFEILSFVLFYISLLCWCKLLMHLKPRDFQSEVINNNC